MSFRSNRLAVEHWRNKVAEAARACVDRPTDDELSVTITHFFRALPRCDADNVSKTICDALTNVVYRDDRQVMECACRRLSIGRAFRLGGMPRELALALCDGEEFVFICVSKARPDFWSPARPRTSLPWA